MKMNCEALSVRECGAAWALVVQLLKRNPAPDCVSRYYETQFSNAFRLQQQAQFFVVRGSKKIQSDGKHKLIKKVFFRF
jgi:hypothetical protein